MEIINLVIADKDEIFLNKISKFIIEKNLGFDIACFTERNALLEYLKEEDVNLLLVDEMFCSKEFMLEVKTSVKIVLTAKKNFNVDGWHSVKKYQKSDDFIKEIIDVYYDANKNEKSEELVREDEIIQQEIHTKVINFCSPTGGSGTTTLSLAYACESALDGDQVFYINLESIDSSLAYFTSDKVIMAEDIESILANEDFFDYEKISLLSTKDEKTGVSFFSFSFRDESLSIYILKLIDIIKKCNIYKYIVLDCDDYLYMKNNHIFDVLDNIHLIVNDSLFSKTKTRHFLKNNINARTTLILNKASEQIYDIDNDYNNTFEYELVVPYVQELSNEKDLEKLSALLSFYVQKLHK